MNGRDRILTVFRGGSPDFVPFCPNLWQWFYSHRAAGTLPPEIAHACHPLDALQFLGADVLARWDSMQATREVYRAGEFTEWYAGERDNDATLVTAFNSYPPRRTRRHSSYSTPYGMLTETWEYSHRARADFQNEHYWKRWEDYPAIHSLLEAREYEFDRAEFARQAARIGPDGVLMANITQSALKTFHWLAGPENASLFMMDHPDEMQELAEIHDARALALVESMADVPEVDVFISLEDLDAPFYPPSLYNRYCASFFERAAARIHARGKFLVAHACGRTRILLPLAGRSGIDCLEGLTPPPMGDVALGDARRLSGNPRFVVNGGMDAPHLGLGCDAEHDLHDYTRALFHSLGDKRGFLFASSCSTPVETLWENLVHFRNAAREYGRLR